MNRVELMPLVTTYQGTGNLGICSVDCCKASSCQDLWLIPIFPKSAESGCGMWDGEEHGEGSSLVVTCSLNCVRVYSAGLAQQV